MKKQRTDEEEREIADCGLQSRDSKIARLKTQTANPNPARSRQRWLLLLLLGGIAVAASFFLDASIRAWVVAHPNRALKHGMNLVSTFGDWPGHVLLGLALLGAATWRKNRHWQRIFLAMLVACALAGIAARVIKIGTGRARPSVQTEATWNGPRFTSKYHAFPSGHTAASTAFFATLAFAAWRIGAPLLVVPMLIAFSRIYVAAHFLSDVVGAAVLGAACASLTLQWLESRDRTSP